METLLQARSISKTYGDRQVVSNVTIEILAGKVVAFLGPNGAGKSTVIKMLTGQISPTAGEIVWKGQSYSFLPVECRNSLGIMPQEVVFWETLTIEENLRFVAQLHRMSANSIQNRVNELISTLHLEKERKTLAGNLSGGYKRRLHLAVSIIHNPDIIFLDEPSPGIDPQSRRLMWEYIDTLRTQGKAILLTDHYLEEAEALADYVHIIDAGKVIAHGTVKELQHKFGEGDIITIVFDTEKSRIKAEIRLQSHYTQVTSLDRTITLFTAQGGKEIGKIVEMIQPIKDSVEEISLKHPSLEDIFLLLTGHEVRD